MLFITRVLTPALLPGLAFTSGPADDVLGLTNHFAGSLGIGIFVSAHALMMTEENIHLPKSKSLLIAAGLISIVITVPFQGVGQEQLAEAGIRHDGPEFVK